MVAAAASKKLPCILDIDQPNVANWAWAGYLAPITGMDDILAKYLPSTVAKWNGKTYAYGYYDVALSWVTRNVPPEEVRHHACPRWTSPGPARSS